MFHRQWRVSAPLVVLIVLFAASTAFCDLSWESEKVTNNVPGQEDGTTIQKNYYTSNASRVEMGDGTVMIMDFQKMMMYRLNTEERTYSEVNLSEMGVPRDMPAEDRERMKKMMGDLMLSFSVTPTDETKTIEGYKCRKYLVSFMRVNSEYWLSKDVNGYDELKKIGAGLSKYYRQNPMLQQLDITGMMDKLDGFPVMTKTEIMEGSMTTVLKKVDVKALSPDLFTVPAGYTLQKAEPQQQGQGRMPPSQPPQSSQPQPRRGY
ncbi:MAG TPA: DUF4412 domain-containing protein [Syntrophobacter fumaroxidans]|nr:DUF4412 domain-containing protein [Syntrophobacter fumaroxidans]